MSTQVCINNILKAADGSLSEDDLAEILSQIEGRVRRRAREFPIESQRDRLLSVAKEMAAEEEIKATIERVTRAKAVIAKRARIAFYDAREAEGLPLAEALNAMNVGSQKGFDGAGRSVYAQSLGLETELLNGMEAELRQAGLTKILAKRDEGFDLDLARELWRQSDPKAAATGNTHAEAAAKIISKYQESARKLLNDAGAWIRKAPGWIVRQSHDPVKMAKAGYLAWRDTIAPLLDERTFDDVGTDRADRERFMRETYDNLKTGIHNTADADWLGGFKGPASRAKKVSQERVLHFTDAAAWKAYNDKFGTGSVLEAVAGGLHSAARNVALMRVWGPNPRAAFDADVRQLLERARDRGNEKEVEKIRNWTTEAFFRQVDGTANAAGNPHSARFHANIRSLISQAKLGGVVLSAFPDIAVRASALRHNGITYLEGLGNGLNSLVEGRSSVEREATLDLVHAGAQGILGDAYSRWSADGTMSGKMSRLNRLFFKLNLQQFWDDRMRGGIGAILSKHLANMQGTAFDRLHRSLQTNLRRYGIGAAEWEVLRKVDARNVEGETFLTGDRIDDLPDTAFEPIVAARMAEHTAKVNADLAARQVKYARRDLKTSLNTFYADQVEESITRPGARERALVTLGTSAGTPVGEAIRYIMQFKAFGVGFATKHIAREFVRNGQLDKTGLATLILGTTALGYIAMTAKEMLKGRNPRAPQTPAEALKVFAAAMAQGGGAGIYGDFLFGEANRFGGGLIATIGGPAVDTAEDIWQLKGKLQRFEDPTANLFQLAKNNTPFLNLFYARLALDHMIFYKIQEAMNPGYLRRMEKRVRDQNQQTFWLKPSSAAR